MTEAAADECQQEEDDEDEKHIGGDCKSGSGTKDRRRGTAKLHRSAGITEFARVRRRRASSRRTADARNRAVSLTRGQLSQRRASRSEPG
jgi:hypothetical protein